MPTLLRTPRASIRRPAAIGVEGDQQRELVAVGVADVTVHADIGVDAPVRAERRELPVVVAAVFLLGRQGEGGGQVHRRRRVVEVRLDVVVAQHPVDREDVQAVADHHEAVRLRQALQQHARARRAVRVARDGIDAADRARAGEQRAVRRLRRWRARRACRARRPRRGSPAAGGSSRPAPGRAASPSGAAAWGARVDALRPADRPAGHGRGGGGRLREGGCGEKRGGEAEQDAS